MHRKMGAARRGAFLRALEATGNVTLAAERAGVSRSWVMKARRAEPDFEAACAAAVAQAAARLGAEEGNRPPAGWGFLDGAELVVRGSNRRRVQIARARAGQWSARTEDRFLAALAATCNVKAACAAAGKGFASAYAHRKRWPDFARRWDEAEAEGDARIEAALVARGSNPFSSDEPPEMELPPMTVEQAIHLLHMHKHKVHGIGKAPGVRWRPPPTLDDYRESILRKFSALERERRLDPAAGARWEKACARRRRRSGA